MRKKEILLPWGAKTKLAKDTGLSEDMCKGCFERYHKHRKFKTYKKQSIKVLLVELK